MSELNHHDALIHLMVTMSAADRSMTDSELGKIGDIVKTLPVFEDYDRNNLIEATQVCSLILQDEDGLDTILDNLKKYLPKKLYDTAYALAVEIASADLHVEQEELRMLQLIRDTLDLDRLTCSAIERGAAARFRSL